MSAEPAADFVPGKLLELRPGVHRVVAPNGGMMTGPGTNTYIVGARRKVVIDPGPADEQHVSALLRATDGGPECIVVTHTHRDHSPAAAMLAARCNAQLIGLPPPADPNHDQTFAPQVMPADSEVLMLADSELQAVFTPGHASNHVCWLHAASGLLFTGDHVMQGGTVVIPPPDGDMAAYLASLDKIARLPVSAIAPGHGTLLTDTDYAIRRLVRHRLHREARVYARLLQLGVATLDELLPLVYADVAAARHPVARYSLHAHLIKLRDEGRVTQAGERWLAPAAAASPA